MTSPLGRISRKARAIGARFRFEVSRPRLRRRDVDARLADEAKGDTASERYYRDLFETFVVRTIHGYRDVGLARQRTGGKRERPPYRLATHVPGGVDPDSVDWHVEPLSGVRWPRRYVGAVSDFQSGSDLVLFWHFNKAWSLLDDSAAAARGDHAAAERWFATVDSWCRQNPYRVGMNWRSPMEIGTRLVTWCVGLSEIGDGYWATEERLARLVESMIRQAEYVAENFSFREISNNHLISDAAQLFVFSEFWPLLRDSRRWREQSERILVDEANRQILLDGFQFENSVCYHVYVVDFYLMYLLAVAAADRRVERVFAESSVLKKGCRDNGSAALESRCPPQVVLDAVKKLAGACVRMISPAGRWPRFGDDSMPEYFVVRSAGDLAECRFEDEVQFRDLIKSEYAAVLDGVAWGRELLDTSSPVDQAHHFDEAGYTVVRRSDSHLVVAAGPEHEKEFNDGHLHCDGGSFELEIGGAPVVIDGGTYLYFFDAGIRRHFKGVSAHNSVRIDGAEPMEFGSTFRWKRIVRGKTVAAHLGGAANLIVVQRRWPAGDGIVDHRRAIAEIEAGGWVIVDRVAVRSDDAAHRYEALFHTPFVPDRVKVDGERGAIIDVAESGRVACRLLGTSNHRGRFEVLSDPKDRRTWFSPWYGSVDHGTTLRVECEFERSVTVVCSVSRHEAFPETLQRANVRVGDGVVAITPRGKIEGVPVAAGTATAELSIDPVSLRLDGLVIAEGEAGL